MGPAQAIRTCLRKVLQTSGRASRAEYTPFFCLMLCLLAGISLFGFVAVGFQPEPDRLILTDVATSLGDAFKWRVLVSRIFWIGCLLIALLLFAAIARRLHDLGWSTRWALAMYLAPVLALILPFLLVIASLYIWPQVGNSDDGRGIGSAIVGVLLFSLTVALGLIAAIWLCFRRSQPGPNRYGPNPLEVTP